MSRFHCGSLLLVMMLAAPAPLSSQRSSPAEAPEPSAPVQPESTVEIRKTVVIVEEIRSEGGRDVTPPLRRAVAVAVIANPFAGRFVEDFGPLIDAGAELGVLLGRLAVEALGVPPDQVESYGKAGIVGSEGEVEHVAAILHPRLGAPFREAVGGGEAIIPSAKKRGGPGTPIDVPLHYKDDAWRFSHFDAVEARVADAPAPDEIVVVLAVTAGGRPHARVEARPGR